MRETIRTRLPTLDAGLVRFETWWAARPPRERMLLGVIAMLLGGIMLIYGVVKPIQGARAQALADIRAYETLTARIRAAGTLTTARPQRRTGTPAEVATQSAGAFGIAITTTPLPAGVRAGVADARYDALVAWLADLASTSDLRVRRASMRRLAAPGHVFADVELGE